MRMPALLFIFTSFLFLSACTKAPYIPPPEPAITVTVSGSAPKFFVTEKCFSVVPQGNTFSMTIILPGDPVGNPVELSQKDMNRLADEVVPTLIAQGVNLRKPFMICATKPRVP